MWIAINSKINRGKRRKSVELMLFKKDLYPSRFYLSFLHISQEIITAPISKLLVQTIAFFPPRIFYSQWSLTKPSLPLLCLALRLFKPCRNRTLQRIRWLGQSIWRPHWKMLRTRLLQHQQPQQAAHWPNPWPHKSTMAGSTRPQVGLQNEEPSLGQPRIALLRGHTSLIMRITQMVTKIPTYKHTRV